MSCNKIILGDGFLGDGKNRNSIGIHIGWYFCIAEEQKLYLSEGDGCVHAWEKILIDGVRCFPRIIFP